MAQEAINYPLLPQQSTGQSTGTIPDRKVSPVLEVLHIMDHHPLPQYPTSQSPEQKHIKISGSVPGVLDPTQPGRLCRHPSSKLTFASFDPLTATPVGVVPGFHRLSLNQELYRPKRIVIETTLSGEHFWRFVPNARRDDCVLDEGNWPRVIEICGQRFECSQDQWDIYKLDTVYDCYVRAFPNLTTIVYKPDQQVHLQAANGKHRSTSLTREQSQPQKYTKRPRLDLEPDSENEYSEVEMMVVDDDIEDMKIDEIPQINSEPEKKKKRKDIEYMFPEFYSGGLHNSRIKENFKTESSGGALPPRNGVNYAPSKSGKRVRTLSPSSMKRELDAKRRPREKSKRVKREKEWVECKRKRDFNFSHYMQVPVTEDLYNGSQESWDTNMSADDNDNENDRHVNSEDSHRAAIEASCRKIAELEADRPLWEAAAAQREKREREEETRRKTQREAAAARVEQQERLRKEEEKRARAREAAQKREQRDLFHRERERRQRRYRSWEYGRWTHQRAMERYLELGKMFDESRFCEEFPLTAEDVPWPVLQSPKTFSVEDLTWEAVEGFFETFRSTMRIQDFKSLLEKSHRRFHPDRWRSRSLLVSVVDEVERGCMEVAANTVAQALTPLWQELRR